MSAVTLTIVLGLALRVLLPLVLVLSVGSLVQVLVSRRQAVAR